MVRRLPLLLLLCLAPQLALGYGYSREDDPLLKAFRAAVTATRGGDLDAARDQARAVAWQTRELADPDDLGVPFASRLLSAHEPGSAASVTIEAWTNLLYLALIQKFHWNLREDLADYHKARARLDAAESYYELALAGNVKKHDAARRTADPKARSRHDDVVAQFSKARKALGSPGLFGSGKRAPDPDAFRQATVRIAGHLRAVFAGFVHPGPKPKAGSGGQ